MKSILVFFGGMSPEHDISVLTGVMTLNATDSVKYNPVPVYIARGGEWYTGDALRDVDFYKNPDFKSLRRVAMVSGDNKLYIVRKNKLKPLTSAACAINCLHGAKGEDGALKGLLDLSGVPLVGAPLAASAVSMDKIATKIFLKGLNIRALPYTVYGEQSLDEAEQLLGYPIFVKPATLGSSIGVNKAANRAELEKSIAKARKFDEKVLLEKSSNSRLEINAAVFRGKSGVYVSECEMPSTQNKFLTFEDKYMGGERVFPAPISKRLSDKIRGIALKIYNKLDFSGVIRVDFLISEGQPYVNEINSVPGSLAYYLFCDTFKDFTQMLTDMIEAALENFNRKSTLITKFDCNILNMTTGKGGKRFDKSR